MLLFCLKEDKKFFIDKYFWIYLIFIFFFGLSSALGGHVDKFFNYLMGFYFTAYIGYWSTKILLQKYKGERLFFTTLLSIGFIDAIVTYTQAFNIDFFTPYLNLFHLTVDEEFLSQLGGVYEFNSAVIPGIMMSPVYNGYFLMVMTILSFSFSKRSISLFSIIPVLFFLSSSFLVQQRAAFFISLLFTFFILIRFSNKQISGARLFFTRLLLISISILGVYLLLNSSIFESSRYGILEMDSTGRDEITRLSLDFLRENIIIGGIFDFGIAPHNIVLSALVYGGLFGGIALFVLMFMQVKTSIVALKYSDGTMTLLACSYLAFTANSILHNSSLVTGDLLLWILWGALSIYLHEEQNRKAR